MKIKIICFSNFSFILYIDFDLAYDNYISMLFLFKIVNIFFMKNILKYTLISLF